MKKHLSDPNYMDGYGLGLQDAHSGAQPQIDLSYAWDTPALQGYRDGYRDGSPGVLVCS